MPSYDYYDLLFYVSNLMLMNTIGIIEAVYLTSSTMTSDPYQLPGEFFRVCKDLV